MQGSPEEVDLRRLRFFGPIRNQGNSPSCYAFAFCDALEFLFAKIRNGTQMVRLSPQDVLDNISSTEVVPRTIIEALCSIATNGCILEQDCPYTGLPQCPTPSRQITLKIHDITYITALEMQEWLKNKGPVIISIPWIDEMHRVRGDIYFGPNNSDAFISTPAKPVGHHMVLVVGCGFQVIDNSQYWYWRIRNSHGMRWGVNGYGRFSTDIYVSPFEPLIAGGYGIQAIAVDPDFDGAGRIFRF